MWKIALLILLELFSTSVFSDQSSKAKPTLAAQTVYKDWSTFNSERNSLFMQEVKVDGRFIVNVRLTLDDTGQYAIKQHQALSDKEDTLLKKIKSLHCAPSDTLGRLAAHTAFMKGNESYCLISLFVTTEGGSIVNYLVVENGTAQKITDWRGDMFGDCCFQSDTVFTGVELGVLENNVFVKQEIENSADLKREYILRLTKTGSKTRHF